MTYISFIFFAVLSICYLYRIKNIDIYVYFGLIVNILIESLRWNVGVDWNSYLYYYQNINDISDSFLYFEKGYYFLNLIFSYFNAPYNLLLFFISSLSTYCIHFSVYKYCNKNPLSICVTLSATHLFLGSNRQMIALSLITLAFIHFEYILKARITLYFYSIIVVSMKSNTY